MWPRCRSNNVAQLHQLRNLFRTEATSGSLKDGTFIVFCTSRHGALLVERAQRLIAPPLPREHENSPRFHRRKVAG
eukprot:12539318-Alexandrium_andersonii.AAC.1